MRTLECLNQEKFAYVANFCLNVYMYAHVYKLLMRFLKHLDHDIIFYLH